MTRNARWLFALALLPVAACSSNNDAAPIAAAPPPPALASVDQNFINTVAAADAAELQGSQLAEANSKKASVKKFAAEMTSSHTASSQQLMTLAQSKGVTPASTPSDTATAMMTKMQGEKGPAFDRDYARGQVMAHQSLVQAYQDEIANGQDADVKAYAQQGLPAVQKQLREARALSGRRA